MSSLDATAARGEPVPRFGLTEADGFLWAVLKHVEEALDGSGIEIEHVAHNQYQEAYHFRRDGESVRLNIVYGGDGKVRRILPPVPNNELGRDIVERLALLPGRTLAEAAPGPSEPDVPTEDNLRALHLHLVGLAEERGMRVAALAPREYCQRYTFARDRDSVVVDFWYNEKGVFRKCQPVNPMRAPQALLSEVMELLSTGLGA